MDGLLGDKTGLSRIPPLAAQVMANIVARTQEEALGETNHWTASAMAKATGANVSSVQRVWRKHGL